MPRVKLFNQEEALIKAMDLFWEKGYASTSLTDLTTDLGISKGSFYDTFGSKHELFEKALALYRSVNVTMLLSVLDAHTDAKMGMEYFFEFTLQHALRDKKRRGCFVANTCVELGGKDDEVTELILEHHEQIRNAIAKHLQKGGYKTAPEAQRLASVFLTYLKGLNQEVKFKQDGDQLLADIRLLMKLLD